MGEDNITMRTVFWNAGMSKAWKNTINGRTNKGGASWIWKSHWLTKIVLFGQKHTLTQMEKMNRSKSFFIKLKKNYCRGRERILKLRIQEPIQLLLRFPIWIALFFKRGVYGHNCIKRNRLLKITGDRTGGKHYCASPRFSFWLIATIYNPLRIIDLSFKPCLLPPVFFHQIQLPARNQVSPEYQYLLK